MPRNVEGYLKPIELQIVIFEPNFTGHRMDYVRSLTSFAAENSINVVFASSDETFASAEFSLRFPHGFPFSTIKLGSLPSNHKKATTTWARSNLKRLSKKFPEARVVVPEGDKLLLSLVFSRLRLSKIILLVMRMPPAPIAIKVTNASMQALAKRSLARLLQLRRASIVVLSPARPISSEYEYVGFTAAPDPVKFAATEVDLHEYQSRLSLDKNRVWFGIFGNITERKNLDLVANSLAGVSTTRSIGLLLSGKIANSELDRCSSALKTLEAKGVPVRTDNRLLSEVELDAAIGCASVAVVAHSSEGPSGIVGKAMATGTWVIAAGAKALSAEIDRFPGIGEFVALEQAELTLAFSRYLNSGISRGPGLTSAGGYEFARALLGFTG